MENPQGTMAPLEEEDQRQSPPILRFDLPSSNLPLSIDPEKAPSPEASIVGMHVAVLVATDVEEAEIVDTTAALRQAGAHVDVISPEGREVQLMRHDDKTRTLPADASL